MSNQLFKGPGIGVVQWEEPFILTDTDQITPLFQIGLNGAVSANASFTPPRLTQTQINALVSPVAGSIVYNTTLSQLQVFI